MVNLTAETLRAELAPIKALLTALQQDMRALCNCMQEETQLEIELDAMMTKAAKIRYLHSKGMPTSAIAKKLRIRYQQAWNVLAEAKRIE